MVLSMSCSVRARLVQILAQRALLLVVLGPLPKPTSSRLVLNAPCFALCSCRRNHADESLPMQSYQCKHADAIMLMELQPMTLNHEYQFLVACTRLYNPLCRSVRRYVRPLVGPSVRRSVGPSHFTFFCFLRFLAPIN